MRWDVGSWGFEQWGDRGLCVRRSAHKVTGSQGLGGLNTPGTREFSDCVHCKSL
jgi:hypothetical protein